MKKIYRYGLHFMLLALSIALIGSASWAQSTNDRIESSQEQKEPGRKKQQTSEQDKKRQKPKKQQGQNSGQDKQPPAFGGSVGVDPLLIGSELLGRPTDHSVTLNVAPREPLEVFFEYGLQPGVYTDHTNPIAIPAQTPVEVELDGLQPDTRYYYRMRYRSPGEA